MGWVHSGFGMSGGGGGSHYGGGPAGVSGQSVRGTDGPPHGTGGAGGVVIGVLANQNGGRGADGIIIVHIYK